MCLYIRVMSPKDADEIANSVDPDQTAPLACKSTLFTQACPKTYLNDPKFSDSYAWTNSADPD